MLRPFITTVVLVALSTFVADEAAGKTPSTELERTFRGKIEFTREILAEALSKIERVATCHQDTNGNSVSVTLYARESYYPLNEYKIETATAARVLADAIVKVDQAFVGFRAPGFWISISVSGSSDPSRPKRNIDYDGLELVCKIRGTSKTLRKGPAELDNDLLACARAAGFVGYLTSAGVDLKYAPISGQEAQGPQIIDGRLRYVDVTITFHELLQFVDDVDFCEYARR